MSGYCRQLSKRHHLKQDQKERCHSFNRKVCLFCGSDENDELKLGPFYHKEDIVTHYFCLLLSSGLFQKTKVSDKKSILGFLLPDIRKEIFRGKKLTCCFCFMKGATIGCCYQKCKRNFHLPCGLKNDILNQFFDNYRSYCADHRKLQPVAKDVCRDRTRKHCSICLCSVAFSLSSHNSLVCPCCLHSFFHRTCIQQLAVSAGKHYFRCPLCNDVEQFQNEMLEFGIYIPDQDASWEKEPNAFVDLLERYDTCDDPQCKCPQGKKHDANSGKYELILCNWCGSSGSHRACGGLIPKEDLLVCRNCFEILEAVELKSKACDTNKNEGLALCFQSNMISPPGNPYTQTSSGSWKRLHPDRHLASSRNSHYSQPLCVFTKIWPRDKVSVLERPLEAINCWVTVHGRKCPFCCYVLLEKLDASQNKTEIENQPPPLIFMNLSPESLLEILDNSNRYNEPPNLSPVKS